MILITTTLAVLGSFGIVYSGLFKSGKYTISNNDLSEVACYKELSGCCCCNYNASYLQATTGGNKCPEWSANDIYSYIGLDFELSGATALISILYLIGAIVVALVTRISLKNYKTDYI